MRIVKRRMDVVALIIALMALFLAAGGSATASEQPAAPGVSAIPLAFTGLTLKNGWTGGPFGTRLPAVTKDRAGIVHLKGAMNTAGTNTNAFTLPLAFRPLGGVVYVTVDLCNANKGRLFIDTTGEVYVQAETTFTQAQCFTSLDGVSFAK